MIFDALYPAILKAEDQIIFSVNLLNLKFHLRSVMSKRGKQLPNSLTATSWPIFRITCSYVISIVVLFDAKNWLELTAIKPLWFALRMLKIAFPKYKISKFPGEACLRNPLDTPTSGGRFSSNSLPFKLTVNCLVSVLELLSVRRIWNFLIPKDWICKLIFFWD